MIKGKAIYTPDHAYDLGYYKTIAGAKRIVGKYLSNSRAEKVELWDGNNLIGWQYKNKKWVMQTEEGGSNGKDISKE